MFTLKQVKAIKLWLGSGSIDIFGRPLAGKDCQCLKLAELLGGKVISGGDILRKNKYTSELLKKSQNSGKMAPSDEYLEIITRYLSKPEISGKPLLLSAVGRSHGEEYKVMQALENTNHPLKLVIYLNISNTESYTRQKMLDDFNDRPNRIDDSTDILKIRNREFNQKTIPVIDYYKQLKLLIEIDGNKPRNEVTNDIINYIYKRIV